MTIETEQSKKMSNEQLLEDIRLTGIELEAYKKIFNGFTVLMNLPENRKSGKWLQYKTQVYIYGGLESQAAEFLNKLYQLKAERGIE